MKLKHLFFNALAVMAFAACSSEAEEIKPAEKASTATLQLDMTGQYGGGSSDQTRTLSLDGTEYPRFIHEEGVTDWKTHCFIRNEAGTVQFYALVDWNATTDSDGNISLHIKNSKLELQNSAGSDVTATETLPKAGERWYIAGIAGGGVLDATNSNVNFEYNHSLDASLAANQLRVPIAFGWTPFTIAKPVSERAPQIVVQFQPQGTLLSVYINNKTNVNQVPLQAGIKVVSNALSQGGVFDYALEADRATYATAPKWTWWTGGDEGMQTFNARGVRVEANTAQNVYFWAMPRTTVPTEGFSTSVGIGGYSYFAEGSSSEKPAATTKAFQTGKSYSVQGVDVGRAYMPYEYLTEYNVAPDGANFVTTQANDAGGYWNWADAVAKFKSITITNQKYHLPTQNEWRGIIPVANTLFFQTTGTTNNQSEYVVSDGVARTETADYLSLGNNIGYAIRHKSSYEKNVRLTAYRYEHKDNPNGGKILKMTCRYLGSGSSTTINDIADESYWAQNTGNDKVFEFPLAGFSTYGVGSEGAYWSSSIISNTSVNVWNFSITANGLRLNSTLNKERKCAVRLFKDEL